MGIETTQPTYKFKCDNCGKVETFAVIPEQQRPLRWALHEVHYTQFDDVGNALKEVTQKYYLCPECLTARIGRVTSPEMSSLAAKYVQYTPEDLAESNPDDLLEDLKSLAGCVLSQDETRSEPSNG